MLLQVFALLIILSLEATFGLPLFFVYLAYRLFAHRNDLLILVVLFVIAFSLAIFYSLSWPLVSLLLLLFHVANSFASDSIGLKLLIFIIFNVSFFFLADLNINYFYLVQMTVFAWYFYRTNFKQYAR